MEYDARGEVRTDSHFWSPSFRNFWRMISLSKVFHPPENDRQEISNHSRQRRNLPQAIRKSLLAEVKERFFVLTQNFLNFICGKETHLQLRSREHKVLLQLRKSRNWSEEFPITNLREVEARQAYIRLHKLVLTALQTQSYKFHLWCNFASTVGIEKIMDVLHLPTKCVSNILNVTVFKLSESKQ